MVTACVISRTTSDKATGYAGEPKRLYLLEAVRPSTNMNLQVVDQRLASALSACGVAVKSRIVPVDTLGAMPDDPEAVPFNADSQLTVIEGRSNHLLLTGETRNAEFDLSLYDVASHSTVWRATVKLAIGGLSDPASKLAQTMVDRMVEDGILRSCKAQPASVPPRRRS